MASGLQPDYSRREHDPVNHAACEPTERIAPIQPAPSQQRENPDSHRAKRRASTRNGIRCFAGENRWKRAGLQPDYSRKGPWTTAAAALLVLLAVLAARPGFERVPVPPGTRPADLLVPYCPAANPCVPDVREPWIAVHLEGGRDDPAG